MAVITFYDTTELDRQQLTDGLQATDHYWEFVDEHISMDNLNPESEIISVFVSSTVTREMIEALPKLTLICCRSTGYNNVDLAAAAERNITVVNVPTYGNNTVAEYVFTMLLALTRRLPKVLETEYEGFWLPELTGMDLVGKTFGVIGSGRIGQQALKMAAGFSMRTLAYDPYPNEEAAKELGFTYVSLEELLAESDVVSLHVPYLTSTHYILNAERIATMKKGAILVNTARGPLVETKALVDALESGQLGGAALDVVESEKLLNFEEEIALIRSGGISEDMMRHSVEISVLKKMPNVIVSPHNAFNTVEAIDRINQTTTENIVKFYKGEIAHQIKHQPIETGTLALLRHTESEWNAKGIWTGVADVELSPKGKEDCKYVAEKMKEIGIKFDTVIHTRLIRTEETARRIFDILGREGVEFIEYDGLMERDYGRYTGQDKWEMKEKLGEEQWFAVRRGWNVPVPDGETLKDVYQRVVPEYTDIVLPRLQQGKNVLLVGHGNSFRALMKYIESIPDDKIKDVEMPINQISLYEVDPKTGLALSGKTVMAESPTGHSQLA